MTLMPASDLRRALRGHGHAMSPIVQIGKLGVTEAVIKQVEQALADHELIKVKIGTECPETRFELAERFGAEAGVHVVQILGRTVLLYKRHPKEPKYEKVAQASRNGPASRARKPDHARVARRPGKR